eukprot:jgi/Bigna1/72532/fgenesh1_pg.20_\
MSDIGREVVRIRRRHYLSIEALTRIIDAAAIVRYAVGGGAVGGGDDGMPEKAAQVHFAAERGVRIVPEIDIPGHSTPIINAFPSLAEARSDGSYGGGPDESTSISVQRRVAFTGTNGGNTPQRTFGVFSPGLNLASNATVQFLDDIFRELADVFPDEYIHVGGDEVFGSTRRGVTIRSAFFRDHLGPFLKRELGRRMVCWDELLEDNAVGEEGSIVQVWRGGAPYAAAARNKAQIVWSEGFYLDLLKPSSEHYLVEPLGEEDGEGHSAESTPTTAAAAAAAAGVVIGGEACMWTELVSESTIESRLWPRAAAIAERLWSPRSTRNVNDMHRRTRGLAGRLELMGATKQDANAHALLLRLSCGDPVRRDALQVVSEMFSPFGLRKRNAPTPHYTSLTPLTGLVDAIPAESAPARSFASLLAAVLKEPGPIAKKRGGGGGGEKANRMNIIRTVKGHLQRWHLATKMLIQSLSQDRSNGESTSSTSQEEGGDGSDLALCPPLDAYKALLSAVEGLTSASYRALFFLDETQAAAAAAASATSSAAMAAHISAQEGSIGTEKTAAVSRLKRSLNAAEALASKSEVKLAIAGPLQTLSAALGGGDPPSGGYRDSCYSCKHSLARLECTCSGRSGQGRS